MTQYINSLCQLTFDGDKKLASKHLEEIKVRLENLEKQNVQNVMSLIEILSAAAFFGNMKKINCEYAKEGQCSFFFLNKKAKKKLPIAKECRIGDCKDVPVHCHLELCNITCTFCPVWTNSADPALKILSSVAGPKRVR